MATQFRLLPALVGAALAAFTAGAAQAQEPSERPASARLPSQIIPTGAEDAPKAAPPTARGTRQAQLESELIRMTSESTAGLVAVTQRDGSTRVDLDGRFMSVAVATSTEDGGNEVTCHAGHEALEKVKYARQVSAGAVPKPMKATPAPAPTSLPGLPEEK